jgi:hypothetical protein
VAGDGGVAVAAQDDFAGREVAGVKDAAGAKAVVAGQTQRFLHPARQPARRGAGALVIGDVDRGGAVDAEAQERGAGGVFIVIAGLDVALLLEALKRERGGDFVGAVGVEEVPGAEIVGAVFRPANFAHPYSPWRSITKEVIIKLIIKVNQSIGVIHIS